MSFFRYYHCQLKEFIVLKKTISGVNIGGAGSYVYDAPANNNSAVDSVAKSEEKRVYAPKAPSKGERQTCACASKQFRVYITKWSNVKSGFYSPDKM